MRSSSLAVLILTSVTVLAVLASCDNVPDHVTVNAAPGVAASNLTTAMQGEIQDLKSQGTQLRQQNLELQKLNASAAGSVRGVQVAAPHITEPADQNAKDAILAEAELARQALELSKDAPPEVVAAYAKKALEAEERVNLFLTGQRDAALKAVASARTDTDVQRAVVAQKDGEIAALGAKIEEKDRAMAGLQQAAASELKADQARMQAIIDKKETENKNLRDAQAAKERSLWINSIRFVCLGFITIGVLAIALTQGKMIVEGAIMAGCGVIGIFVAMGFDILVHQAWFPYAFGAVLLTAVVAFGVWLWRMFKAHQLAVKATAVFDDIKTEATTAGNTLWKQVQEHTDFRGITGLLEQQATKLGLDEKPAIPATPVAPVKVV